MKDVYETTAAHPLLASAQRQVLSPQNRSTIRRVQGTHCQSAPPHGRSHHSPWSWTGCRGQLGNTETCRLRQLHVHLRIAAVSSRLELNGLLPDRGTRATVCGSQQRAVLLIPALRIGAKKSPDRGFRVRQTQKGSSRGEDSWTERGKGGEPYGTVRPRSAVHQLGHRDVQTTVPVTQRTSVASDLGISRFFGPFAYLTRC
ncbi:hypothetical protein AWB70_04331 [Caballeronia cordobensis]|uniref:Uncharacterized protein n=1 Tax=Caballeronia cordobensis TaxID=1353886 RepID=A0A158I6X0_CABCO|nr:hypothetical protein AWB70_04331 [Caballeronia cordobensis]